MTGWTLADDAHGDPTIWHGPTAVARPGDLRVAPGYQQALFDALVALAVQPPEVVDRVAEALYKAPPPSDEPTWRESGCRVQQVYRRDARAALDALAPDVPRPGPSPALAWTPPDVSVAQAAVTGDAMDRVHDAVLGQEDEEG